MSTEQTNRPEQEAPPQIDNGHGKDFVTVIVDNNQKSIHRGDYVVANLKSTLGVDAGKELDQVIGGEFKPLEDTAHITIKGGEVFISHNRRGGSSK